ncbi:DNA cytosine methyltransferase [Cupriavidus basilensis]|uniref:DNA cytosine methyltransferase n=1 Tax=Cupriavidus basilensis TaxID=68895 RepID=UPI0039F72393
MNPNNIMTAADLFAGGGGFTTGAEMAGVNVVWAANHSRAAVDTHAANHPSTVHACQDLHQANWAEVPQHDLLLASPCCQGHSKARGKAANNPQHDASRSTAWAVVDAVEFHLPQFAVIENVPEFIDWRLYPAWSAAMNALGYQLAPHIVDAADHGVPQHRERLFIVASRSARPLMLQLPKQRYVAAATVIDFDAGKWSPVEKPGRSPKTLARVAAGRARHGERFVMPYYGSGSGLTGRSLDRPLGTITTIDRWAVVNGDRMRMLRADECRAAMGFPAGYQLPEQHKLAVHLLGNAVCPPVARDVINAIRRAA